ncbi:MAG: PD-(D/E)XK nuclease family protein [Thermoanaerobaculales bacterium]|nr:PD-(D/E)XK nuclease family protein [Thermoanaerobaculales bacterium]
MPPDERAPTPRNLYSFSRVKTYHQCPLRYRYRYLKGLKEAFRSIESVMGTVVHGVLEWLYGEREGRGAPSLEATMEALAERWSAGLGDDVAVVRDGDRAEDHHLAAREMLERFHRGAFSRDRSTTLALEQRLSRRLSEEIVFTGFADRVGRTRNGGLFVIDYKTSKKEGDSSEFSEGLQAPLYAACVLERHDDGEALAGYHYLRHDRTSWQKVERGRADELLGRFRQLAEEVAGASEFPARPGVLCAWCGFNAICPSAEVPAGLSGGLERARELSDRTPSLYET